MQSTCCTNNEPAVCTAAARTCCSSSHAAQERVPPLCDSEDRGDRASLCTKCAASLALGCTSLSMCQRARSTIRPIHGSSHVSYSGWVIAGSRTKQKKKGSTRREAGSCILQIHLLHRRGNITLKKNKEHPRVEVVHTPLRFFIFHRFI